MPSTSRPGTPSGLDGSVRDALHVSLRRVSDHLGFEATLGPLPAADARPRLAPGELAGPTFEQGLAVVGQLGGVSQRRVAATWLQGYLAYYLLTPVLEVLMAEQRLLDLSPDRLEMAWDGEDAPTVVYRGSLAVLPGDPLAGRSAVTTCADEAALVDRLHDMIVACFELTLAVFREGAGLSSRLQWSQVADRAAVSLQYAGKRLGREAHGIALAEQLMGRPGSPIALRRGGFLTVRVEDLERVIWRREACCLSYESPEGEYCMTCPALDTPERRRRMEAWVREEASAA